MANACNESEVLDGSDREEDMVIGAEFKTFQCETQQELREVQETLARLTTGSNQRGDNPMGRQPYSKWAEVFRECHPENPRRQLAYENNSSEDEKDAEAILQNTRRGYQGEQDRQTFHVDLLNTFFLLFSFLVVVVMEYHMVFVISTVWSELKVVVQRKEQRRGWKGIYNRNW
ncbi:unnamed protein product [Ilex paraguariensis]|uniref:Uncharacterized protein n=1 Tax=Ilex paraguariensis TaxID=185542 RepID=A0ABC8TU60_9AQUA